jgi:hypothetical protein
VPQYRDFYLVYLTIFNANKVLRGQRAEVIRIALLAEARKKAGKADKNHFQECSICYGS